LADNYFPLRLFYFFRIIRGGLRRRSRSIHYTAIDDDGEAGCTGAAEDDGIGDVHDDGAADRVDHFHDPNDDGADDRANDRADHFHNLNDDL
jgi:hypothetical protein